MSKKKKPDSMSKISEDAKKQQMKEYTRDSVDGQITTNHGVKVTDTDNSLKAGSRGPTIMEDFHFREKLMHFDHERIPERIVHARGSGAYGYFQVYEPMAEFTKANFLQDPSVKTPVFVRFSTVVGFRGSADTVRDARGFAVKFYTAEGNYDLVGNNMPVFFIQDAIKFPDLVHSIKPEQHHQMPQASAAHDTFWDFIANTPESAHMIMWVLSDRGLPRSYRMMDGFGVHTFRFVNASGKGRFVKFHWRSTLGAHSLVWDETQKIAGKDPDFNRRDLWENIEMGNFPEFELGVQIVEEEDEHKFDFDLLDATKIIPEEEVPIKIIGKMILNRNPDNFFAETEQVAFHPGHVVPGIDFTNDPLLQGRLFSYLDTQLIRLGGPNFNEIPVNRPLVPVHNNQREGYHRTRIDKGPVSYTPNTIGGGCPFTAKASEGGFEHYAQKIEGQFIRQRSDTFKDHFSQASLFYNSMSDIEKKHILEAFHFELGMIKSKEIRKAIVDMFNNVDGELAANIALGVAVDPPSEKKGKASDKTSHGLSQQHTIFSGIKTRKIAAIISDGFNSQELSSVKEALMNEGCTMEIISKKLGMIKPEKGDEVEAVKSYTTTASVLYDGIYIPGGESHINAIKTHGDAIHFVNECFAHCKPIGASGKGVDFLIFTNLKGIRYAKESGATSDKGVVTSRESSTDQFIEKFKEAIKSHRHWDRESKEEVPA